MLKKPNKTWKQHKLSQIFLVLCACKTRILNLGNPPETNNHFLRTFHIHIKCWRFHVYNIIIRIIRRRIKNYFIFIWGWEHYILFCAHFKMYDGKKSKRVLLLLVKRIPCVKRREKLLLYASSSSIWFHYQPLPNPSTSFSSSKLYSALYGQLLYSPDTRPSPTLSSITSKHGQV